MCYYYVFCIEFKTVILFFHSSVFYFYVIVFTNDFVKFTTASSFSFPFFHFFFFHILCTTLLQRYKNEIQSTRMLYAILFCLVVWTPYGIHLPAIYDRFKFHNLISRLFTSID